MKMRQTSTEPITLPDGTHIDFVDETANGQPWTAEQRTMFPTVAEIQAFALQDQAHVAALNVASTIEQRAATALAANDAFLALAAPTNAQVLAQTKILTKECTAIIKLLLNRLDSVDGT